MRSALLALLLVGCIARGPQPVYLDMDADVVASACQQATGNPQAWGCANITTGLILCPNDFRNEACRAHELRHLREPHWRHAADDPIRAPWTVGEFMERPWRIAR